MTPLAVHRVERLGLNLVELSERSLISISALSAVERGYRHKYVSRRRKFAAIYKLNLKEFERLVLAAGEGRKEKHELETSRNCSKGHARIGGMGKQCGRTRGV